MLIHGVMFRACSIGGLVCKPALCSRLPLPFYQQSAGVKSIENELGLPEKPKRPLAAFILFSQMVRPKLAAENPGMASKDIVRLIGKEWKTCDEDLKSRLEKQTQTETLEYAAKLEKYHLSLTREDLQAIKDAKMRRRAAKAVKAQKMQLKKLDKPKKPPNAFFLYVEDQVTKENCKDLSVTERAKKYGLLWKQESEATLSKYRKRSAEASEKYRQEREAWEERMAAEGYLDPVYETGRGKAKKRP